MAIAKDNLFVGGVLAHTAGDHVPDANVEPNGWGDLVEEGYPLSAAGLQARNEAEQDEPLPVEEPKAQAPAASTPKAQAQPNQS